jgi:sodium transport system permease protein
LGLPNLSVETETPDDAVLLAAREVVSRKEADAVLLVWPGFDDALQRHHCGQVSVYYDSVIPKSAQAWSRLQGQLSGFRQHLRQERQQQRGLPEGFVQAMDIRPEDVAPLQRQVSDLLGRTLPVVIILLAMVGALVASMDMTAGEKDRATMQTLLCAPVRSLEIVGGKFLAVWTISLISVVANLVGVGLTIGRVASALHVEIIPWGTLVSALGLLLPATSTIAALFLAVAALARDVKDAGNFLGGLSFGVMLLVGVAFLPGVELDAWTCCVPLVNVSLLIRALMTGAVAPPLIFVTLLTSVAYAGLALGLGARVFGREQNLLGGPITWRSFLRGDKQAAAVPTPGLVLIVFPLAVVALFYLSLALASHGLTLTLLVTQYGVLFLPVVALALVRKFPLADTFSLRRPHWRSVAGSVLIGLSASVALAGLVLRLMPPPDSLLKEMQELLRFGGESAPLWKLWLLIALTPALCEETFFRGLMLSGLKRWGPWVAIGLTALFFGLLHASIYRLMPIFILGLLLGYAVWRSGSLYCSILIHLLNNSLVVAVVWFSEGKDTEMRSVPWSLTLGALVITAIGLALLTRPKPGDDATARSQPF